MRRILIGFFIFFCFALVLLYAKEIPNAETYPLRTFYLENALSQTGAVNSITSIYLFYRYYDTLFETLMLLFSIIGVIHMSVHGEEDEEDDF